tara:strand:- start:7993 stop:8859 length:867 start_codon:yes stop_codon:yes gene_type:complete
MQISASSIALSGHSFSVACDAIASAGFAFIEPAFIPGYALFSEDELTPSNAARLLHLAQASGLECRSLSAHVDLGAESAVDATIRRLVFAGELGASYLIGNAAAEGREEAFARNVEAIAPKAEQYGVTICVENPGHGTSVFRSASDMICWKEKFDHPSIDLNYDTGNVFTANDEAVDLRDDISIIAGSAAHYHLKDVLSDQQGWQMCPTGAGSVPIGEMLRILADRQPDAPICVEMPLRLRRPNRGPATFLEPVSVPDAVAALSQSHQFIAEHFTSSRRTSAASNGDT